MSYRDELEHASARVNALEERVAELEHENDRLRQALEDVEDERDQPPSSTPLRVYQLRWMPPRAGGLRLVFFGLLLWVLMTFAGSLVFTMR